MAITTEWTMEIKACSAATLSAILGGEAEGCVIYDKASDAVSAEFQICGGVIVGVALKVGGGVDVSNKKVTCAKAKVSVPLDTQDKIKHFLTSDESDSQQARELFKEVLLEKLKASGVPQSELDNVQDIEFGPFIDGAGRESEIKQNFQQCGAGGPIS
jgi:hypothetical protein